MNLHVEFDLYAANIYYPIRVSSHNQKYNKSRSTEIIRRSIIQEKARDLLRNYKIR